MKPCRERGDSGSASVEFVALSVVLLVPLVSVMLTVSEVQRAAYAAAGASREAGRTFVTAPDGATGMRRADLAAAMAFEDQGVRGEHGLDLECSANPCLSPGARVRTVVTARVRVPLIPTLGDAFSRSIRVRARHVEVVDDLVAERP